MFGLGVGEILIILVIALIFIGPKKLPELAKGLGKAMREFQNAAKGITDSINIKEDLNKIQEDIKSSVQENIEVEPKVEAPSENTTDEKSSDSSPDEENTDPSAPTSIPRK